MSKKSRGLFAAKRGATKTAVLNFYSLPACAAGLRLRRAAAESEYFVIELEPRGSRRCSSRSSRRRARSNCG